jgi:pimeloyl-ACP methyl ester carboxylesterase
VPVVLVQAYEDEACPVEGLVRPMERALPDAKVEILKGVGHFLQTEAVGGMERLIDGFVKSL